MNATNVVTRVLVCGAMALTLTVGSGLGFVQSTARAYFATDIPTVIVLAKADHVVQVAQNDATGLLQ